MAIYIKGVEMPKHCIDCPFMVSRDNDDCVLQSDEANAKFDSWNDMKASCPLVEVPEPHGRLIDETKAMDILDEYRDKVHIGKIIYTLFFTEVIDCVKLVIKQFTPTVIEGSEE